MYWQRVEFFSLLWNSRMPMCVTRKSGIVKKISIFGRTIPFISHVLPRKSSVILARWLDEPSCVWRPKRLLRYQSGPVGDKLEASDWCEGWHVTCITALWRASLRFLRGFSSTNHGTVWREWNFNCYLTWNIFCTSQPEFNSLSDSKTNFDIFNHLILDATSFLLYSCVCFSV